MPPRHPPATLLLAAALGPLATACADPPCPGLPASVPSDWATIPAGVDPAAWDAAIVERMREGCIPGLSVAVVDEDGEIMRAAWGFANIEVQQPVTTQTPFMLASISKAVDALALVAARDEGLLEFDDPVGELVGMDVRNQRLGAGPPILLHHLATHSSGIQDDWDVLDDTYHPGDPSEPLGEFLAGYLEPGGRHFSKRGSYYPWPAGREWMYSNVGAALAAYAVEVQSGEPYDAFCEQRLFEPLGLEHTGWFLADFDDPDAIARPHQADEDGWNVREHYGYPTWPDGQLRATAGDLSRLLRLALGDGEIDGVRVLEPGVFDVLTTAPIDGLNDWFLRQYLDQQYFFWFGTTLGDRRLVGHNGGDYGVSTEMFFDVRTRVGVVVLTNGDESSAGDRLREQTQAIQEILFELGDPR